MSGIGGMNVLIVVLALLVLLGRYALVLAACIGKSSGSAK
jgi:hypothetical protein